MKTNNYLIRLQKESELREVENLVRDSFWNVYRPGCSEHLVLHNLQKYCDFIPSLSFVMEQNGILIGQNVFCKTKIKGDNGKDIPILTMGPICIKPSLKRKGYGKILLDYSLQKATELGYGAICFEGNIDFYGKSGFDFASKFNIRYHGLKEEDDSSFFLCKELIPNFLAGVSGEYSTPEVYLVSDKEVELFDKNFTPKQKLKLPGQLF